MPGTSGTFEVQHSLYFPVYRFVQYIICIQEGGRKSLRVGSEAQTDSETLTAPPTHDH